MVDSNFVAAITILAVIISFLGAIQITFQGEIQTAIQQVNKSINGSYRNFLAITESEKTIITLLLGVNRSMADMIERDANLTKEETEKLVSDLQKIPDIVSALENITQKVETDAKGAQIHRNLTIENNDDIQDIKETLQTLTNTTR
jgi:Asp-tRNA(Asn)/Glu-tRNA(Gln) amidotransferase C subunit